MATDQPTLSNSEPDAPPPRDIGRWVAVGMLLTGFASFATGMALFSPRVALVVCGPLIFAGGVAVAIFGRR